MTRIFGMTDDASRGADRLSVLTLLTMPRPTILLEERARTVGGSLSIRSAPGSGTQVVATIPIPDAFDEAPPVR
jgi:hypothetical protein